MPRALTPCPCTRRRPVHRPTRAGGGAPEATYGPATLCYPRAVRLLARHLALVDERSRQGAVPALGDDEPRAPHPHVHCHLPGVAVHDRVVAQASLRRRRVLMASSLLPTSDAVGEIGPRRAERRDRCAGSVDAGSSVRPTRPDPPAFAAQDCTGRPLRRRCRRVGGRCEDGAMSGHPLARVHRRRLATQRMSSAGMRTGRRRAPAHLRAVAGRARSPRGRSACGCAQGTTYADVLAEQSAGGWVRTHMLRPTWHLVAPEDLRWVQRATGPRVERRWPAVTGGWASTRRRS